jgi:hypothetical protein
VTALVARNANEELVAPMAEYGGSAFARTLASVAVKMFSDLILLIKMTYFVLSLGFINIPLHRITVQHTHTHKKVY